MTWRPDRLCRRRQPLCRQPLTGAHGVLSGWVIWNLMLMPCHGGCMLQGLPLNTDGA